MSRSDNFHLNTLGCKGVKYGQLSWGIYRYICISLRVAFNKHKKAQQKFSDVQMEQQNMILINLNSRCHKR